MGDSRREKKSSRRRHRSSSASGEDGGSLGSLLKKSRRSPSTTVPKEVSRELECPSFDASRLSEAAAQWIEKRIAEQVSLSDTLD